MAFTYSDHRAVDEALGLRIEQDPRWWGGDIFTLVTDLVGEMTFAFMPMTEKRHIAHPRWNPDPFPCEVAHRLSRPALWPYMARLANDRGLDIYAMAEAFRQGVFAYDTHGGAVLEWVPDFEVTWVATSCVVSGPLNRVVFTR